MKNPVKSLVYCCGQTGARDWLQRLLVALILQLSRKKTKARVYNIIYTYRYTIRRSGLALEAIKPVSGIIHRAQQQQHGFLLVVKSRIEIKRSTTARYLQCDAPTLRFLVELWRMNTHTHTVTYAYIHMYKHKYNIYTSW